MFCQRCGKQTDGPARYCASCGNPIQAASVSPVAAVPLGRPPTAKKISRKVWILVLVLGAVATGVAFSIYYALGIFGLAPSLSPEANAQARAYWDKTVMRCGSRTFISDMVPGTFEYKDFSYTVTSSRLDDSDRLNGYEWKGESKLTARFCRRWNSGRQWSPWMDADYCRNGVEFSKKNGSWYYGRGEQIEAGKYHPEHFLSCENIDF